MTLILTFSLREKELSLPLGEKDETDRTAKTCVFDRGTFSPLGREGRDGPHSQNVCVRSRNFLSPWERRTRRAAQPKCLCSIEELSLPLGEKDATAPSEGRFVFGLAS